MHTDQGFYKFIMGFQSSRLTEYLAHQYIYGQKTLKNARKLPKNGKKRKKNEAARTQKNFEIFFARGRAALVFSGKTRRRRLVVAAVSEKKLRGKNFRAEGPKIFSESAVVVVVVVVSWDVSLYIKSETSLPKG